ncbi:MAG TPA: hypothetical protein DEF82_08620 [Crocinitomicaceae bacterium]|nr:hypothetical protein [Flavobacteriales bacterium]HBW86781.1 hypothetical protein [Crocinitomicaceae bacterium]
MNKYIYTLLFIGMCIFHSCSNDESSDSTKNKNPQTACECIENYAKEVEKIANMSDEQFAKSGNEIESLGAKMDSDSVCNKLIEEQQKKYSSPKEFQKEFEKSCPSLTKLMENMMKIQERMMLNMSRNSSAEAMPPQEF